MLDTHLKILLDRIIAEEQLTAVFQPIVSLNQQSIFGYEGLIRGPADSLLYRPSVLFAVAAKYQRLAELDCLCHKIVIRQFAKLKLPGRLFININPAILGEADSIDGQTDLFLQNHDLDPNREVIEITLTQPAENPGLLQRTLKHYRNIGLKVALDDLGAGFSDLKLWSELRPDFVKITRHFIQSIDADKSKRQFIKSILEIAKTLGCETIAGGIETKSEYATLRKLGVTLAQGHYFDQPLASPSLCLKPGLFSKRPLRGQHQAPMTAARLLKQMPAVEPMTGVEELGELFHTNQELRSIAVVEDGEPLGLVLRNELMSLLDRKDRRGRQPIKSFICQHALIVEKTTPLEEVSQRLTTMPNGYTEEFIITENGQFVGKGTSLDLLRTITEWQVKSVRHANPLTLLPGTVVIQQTLDEQLSHCGEFAVAYCDLDHFKAYNDAYGYERGDEMIQLLGRLLRETVAPEWDFVGHHGGDDFVVVYRSPDWTQRCDNLLYTFQSLIGDCYSAKDRQQGGIEATDRYGVKRRFPVMSLAIGAVSVGSAHQRLTTERIAELATAALAKAKANNGNCIYVDTYDEGVTEPHSTDDGNSWGNQETSASQLVWTET
ncbi:MAG TPA: GGDEF domain-containing protein [Methylococcaceae bacterium]|jgi:diguanylate cyclase (GGDEF)-like protein|nr:GGDEF domain-containing protein [Methylococcaceae bacterium]